MAHPLHYTPPFAGSDVWVGENEMGIWGRRVVVIDDDVDTLEILSRVLRDHGADVVAVDHPGAALATILGVMPDVLLVDIAMPDLDGVSLMRKLRSLSPERGGRVPAATLSASSPNEEELAAWRAAGFQKHIAKPFAPHTVVAIVEELSGGWVERRRTTLERRQWPTPRERRSERRGEPPSALPGMARGNERLFQEA
jgi:CheY-like chemotaxis protein